METIVGGELRVERRDEDGALPRQHGHTVVRRRAPCTSAPTRSTFGARMNTAWNGAVEACRRRCRPRSCRPDGRNRCAAPRCRSRRSCADRGDRRAPRWRAGSCPRRCRTPPCRRRVVSRCGSNSPEVCSSRDIVVLSPPGITSASRSSRSLGTRTWRVWAPHSASADSCAANAPCSASTPDQHLGAPNYMDSRWLHFVTT